MWLDPVLAVIVLAGFVPLLLLTRWFQRRSRASYRRTRDDGGPADRAVRRVDERHPGGAGLPAGGAQRRDHGRARRRLPRRQRRGVPHGRLVHRRRCALVGNLTLALVLAARRRSGWLDGALELGALTAFLLYLRRFYDPLDELAQFFNAYQSAAAALEKIADGAGHRARGARAGARRWRCPAPVRGELEFDAGAVRLPADAADRVVLPEFVAAHPGRADGGAGRRDRRRQVDARQAGRPLLRPDRGRGPPRRRRPARRRRRRAAPRAGDDHAGGVPVLRVGGRQHRAWAGRTRPAPRSSRPPTAVGAREFVEALPEGFDTDVRKRGGRLSAGQRQLVSLARVVLADPAVVLLDEATSSLDVPSRAGGAGGAGDGARRPHRADHRAPAVDGADRRPRAGARRRAGSCRTAAPEELLADDGRVRRAPRRLARQPRLEHLTPPQASLRSRDGESPFPRRRVSVPVTASLRSRDGESPFP